MRNQQILLRVPEALLKKLKRDAEKNKRTVQSLLIEQSSSYYKIAFEPPIRGGMR
jgi:hypothetical protein